MSHLRIVGDGSGETTPRLDFINDTPTLSSSDLRWRILGRGEDSAQELTEVVTSNWEEFNYHAGFPDELVDSVVASAEKTEADKDSSDWERNRAQRSLEDILRRRDLRDNGDPDIAWFMSSAVEIETVTNNDEEVVVPSRWLVGIPRDGSNSENTFSFRLEPAIIGQPTKYPSPEPTALVHLDFASVQHTDRSSVTSVEHYRYGYNEVFGIERDGVRTNRLVETEDGRLFKVVAGDGRRLDPTLDFEYAKRYHNILGSLIRSLDTVV